MASENTGTSLAAILRDMRGAIGDLFGGGKLPKEQEVPVQVLFSLVGYVAKADSIVTSHEADFANTLMDELGLPSSGLALASDSFERGMRRQIDVDEEATRIRAIHPVGSPELLQLFDTLIRVAIADGRLFPREREALEKIALALGFNSETLGLRLAKLESS